MATKLEVYIINVHWHGDMKCLLNMTSLKLVLAKGSGVITGTDVMEHLTTLAMDDRYEAPMKKLVDYRNVDSIRISPEEGYSIARMKVRFAKCVYRREMRLRITEG